ncbi:hypothetical protein K435DRAFT_337702 [Dendrothele bispora CBS 962.96]|uniref:Uncharacterized protein n=1 Tax=Dendrothele bispora (strain CBS 962.96) TaxID=1314807 RepID=A0A4S8MK49_DENBC|nr:hypothetical protein K435DRAFT_337702 [Dendrothele bispora CBS 962.96]
MSTESTQHSSSHPSRPHHQASSSSSSTSSSSTILPTTPPSGEHLTTRFSFSQPTFILSILSLFLSLAYLVLSFLDNLGHSSFYTGPPIALGTIGFYTVVWILTRLYKRERRRRREAELELSRAKMDKEKKREKESENEIETDLKKEKETPSYPLPPAYKLLSILLSFCLFLSWLAPLSTTIYRVVSSSSTPGNERVRMIVQIVLAGVNLFFMGVVVSFLALGRRQFVRREGEQRHYHHHQQQHLKQLHHGLHHHQRSRSSVRQQQSGQGTASQSRKSGNKKPTRSNSEETIVV